MNSCEQINAKFIDYLSGELPEQEAEALRNHCEECTKCRESLAAQHIILRADASSPLADIPDHIANRILQASVHSVQPAKKPRPWRLITTLAALLLLCASLWMSFGGLKFKSTGPILKDVVQSAQELQSQGQEQRAIALLNARLVESSDNSESPVLMHELGKAHRKAGELDRAYDLLSALKADYPGYQERLPALLLLGDVMEAMQRWDGAALHYAWLAEEYPENQSVQELHSKSLATSGTQELRNLGYLGYIGD